MSRKAFEMGHLSLYRGFVRGTWREASYTEGYETFSGRLWKWSISFTGLHKGNLKHLAREGSANLFIGVEPLLVIFLCYV
jgi:hypothetical protein